MRKARLTVDSGALRLIERKFLIRSRALRWSLRCVALFVLAVLIAHPWVIEWWLRGRIELFGAAIEGERSVSYQQIRWESVSWSNESTSVQATGVEIGLLPRFFRSWQDLFGDSGLSFFHVSELEVTSSGAGASADSQLSLSRSYGVALEGIYFAEKWLPPVRVDSFSFSGADVKVLGDRLSWRDGRFQSGAVEVKTGPVPGQFDFALPQGVIVERVGQRVILSGAIEPVDERWFRAAEVRLEAWRESDGLRAEGKVRSEAGELTGTAHWSDASIVPDMASVRGQIVQLHHLAEEGPVRPKVVRIEGNLDGAQYRLKIGSDGDVVGADNGFNRAYLVNLVLNGNPESVEIRQMDLSLPGMVVRLDQALGIDLVNLKPLSEAHLDFLVDLAATPGVPLAGTLQGSAEVSRKSDTDYAVDIKAKGTDLSYRPESDRVIEFGDFSGHIQSVVSSETIEVSRLVIDGDVLGQVEGSGEWHHGEASELNAKVQVRLPSQPWVSPDASVSVSDLDCVAGLEFSNGVLRHWGDVSVDSVDLSGFRSVAVEASWSAEDLKFDRMGIIATISPELKLSIAGDGYVDNEYVHIGIESLEEEFEGNKRWSLVSPVAVEAGRNAMLSDLRMDRVRLAAPSGSMIELNDLMLRAESVSGSIRIAEMEPADVRGWVDSFPEQWRVRNIDARLEADWVDDAWQLQGSQKSSMRWRAANGDLWYMDSDISLGQEWIEVGQMEVRNQDRPWLSGRARIPLSVRLDRNRPQVEFSEASEIDLSVNLSATEALPPYFSRQLPVQLENVSARMDIGGTVASPVGQVELFGDEIAFAGGDGAERLRFISPRIQARFSEASITLDQIAFRLSEKAAEASVSGAVSGADGWLTALAHRDRWGDLSIALRGEHVPLKAVESYLPDALLPAGEFTFDIEKDGDSTLSGHMDFSGLGTRVLPNNASLRELEGSCLLTGRKLEFSEITGLLGGRRLTMAGWIDLTRFEDPLFDVELNADRVDLVRQVDLILRASGTLRVARTDAEAPPMISGELTLRDGLLLRDFRDFTRFGVSGRSRRPPYFSIEDPAFSDWRLNLRIGGEEFINVRTPVFVGRISADFQLKGDLGDPLLYGRADVAAGSVIFPFARIEAGRLSGVISVEDPHVLRLNGSGSGSAFGYNIQMTLSGTASDPEIVMSSVPSLAQDEIILMIAAGAIPTADRETGSISRAGQIALYLGRDVFSDLIGGEDSSRVEIRASNSFSPLRGDGKVIEYHLDDRWSLIGEYDDYGDYNLDVKWNLFRK